LGLNQEFKMTQKQAEKLAEKIIRYFHINTGIPYSYKDQNYLSALDTLVLLLMEERC
jgi:hypothetical protein